MKRTIRTTAPTVGALAVGPGLPAGPAEVDSAAPRIGPRVLRVSDGGSAVDAVAAELGAAATPFTRMDLTRYDRPTIDCAFLSDPVDGRPRGKVPAGVGKRVPFPPDH